MVIAPEIARRTDKGATKVKLEGRCRMCRRPSSVRTLTRHHLVPQVWFRRLVQQLEAEGNDQRAWEIRMLRDADANIVPLCVPCHKQVEGDTGYRRMLRKLLDPVEATFCVKVRGLRWFDLYYPA